MSTPPAEMELVVNGSAVRFLLSTAAESSKVAKMLDAGVSVHACANDSER